MAVYLIVCISSLENGLFPFDQRIEYGSHNMGKLHVGFVYEVVQIRLTYIKCNIIILRMTATNFLHKK